MIRTSFSSVYPNTAPSSSPVSEKRRKGRRNRRNASNAVLKPKGAVASLLKQFGL